MSRAWALLCSRAGENTQILHGWDPGPASPCSQDVTGELGVHSSQPGISPDTRSTPGTGNVPCTGAIPGTRSIPCTGNSPVLLDSPDLLCPTSLAALCPSPRGRKVSLAQAGTPGAGVGLHMRSRICPAGHRIPSVPHHRPHEWGVGAPQEGTGTPGWSEESPTSNASCSGDTVGGQTVTVAQQQGHHCSPTLPAQGEAAALGDRSPNAAQRCPGSPLPMPG